MIPTDLPFRVWLAMAPAAALVCGLLLESWLSGIFAGLMILGLAWLFKAPPDEPEARRSDQAPGELGAKMGRELRDQLRGRLPGRSRSNDRWLDNSAWIMGLVAALGAPLIWFGFAVPAIDDIKFRQRDDLVLLTSDTLRSRCEGKACGTKNYYAGFTLNGETYRDVLVAAQTTHDLGPSVDLLVDPKDPRHAQVIGQNDTPRLILASIGTLAALWFSIAFFRSWRIQRHWDARARTSTK